MPVIPYGYEIHLGKAVVLEEQAVAIRNLFEAYCKGDSIAKAKKESGISVCVRTANSILQNSLYTGTSYYPAIISEELFKEAQIERKIRSRKYHHVMRKPLDPIPVTNTFTFERKTIEAKDPLTRIALLYGCVRPSESGQKYMNLQEKAQCRSIWRKR